jgi:putative redox protein
MSETFDRIRRVVSSESGLGPYAQIAVSRRHVFTADEPVSLGGLDTGPDPIEMLISSLAACTAMTIRMYTEQRKLDVGKITVTVEHQWIKGEDGKTRDHLQKLIHFEPMPAPDVLDKILGVAERCPVHRALSGQAVITSRADP